jgi:hypothetical protein
MPDIRAEEHGDAVDPTVGHRVVLLEFRGKFRRVICL